MPRSAVLLLPLLLAPLTACGATSDAVSSSSAVAIAAGSTTCAVSDTTLEAGKVTFAVKNTGSDVTEVYVYGKGSSGAFDRVVGEVENLAPSTSRDFPVTLTGGTFEVACKPGSRGNGIRTALTVSGAAAGADSAHDRELELAATEYAYEGLDGFTAEVGEKIEFHLENRGKQEHELEVLKPDGSSLGEVGPTAPGQDGEVVLELPVAGTYTVQDGIADHAQRGMKKTFTVR